MSALSNNTTLRTSFNESPYWDDYREDKGFHRILYVPEMGVQGRELTQTQTILQNQISRFANHIFKDGSRVAGGEFLIDVHAQYVKLKNNNSLGNTINIANFDGATVTGATTGITARVVAVASGSEAANPNLNTLIVRYTSANTAGSKTFLANEVLTANTGFTATVTNLSDPVGRASMFTIREGIIYAKGHFVYHDEQSIILEKYNSSPSYRVGFVVTEDIITSDDDATLLDPASEASAYQAPGAHRLKLSAALTKVALGDTPPEDFVELFTIKSGVLQQTAERTQYSDIRDELARRTYDESGDYVVRGLTVRVREHLNDGENNGRFTLGEGGNTQQLAVGVEPGLAYVRGYDYETLVTRWLPTRKGVDYKDVEEMSIAANYGSYVVVKNFVGFLDVYTGLKATLYNTAQGRITDGNGSSAAPSGSAIGTARVRAVVWQSGTQGTASAQYKVYLYDIQMTSADFRSVRSIYIDNASGTDACGDIVLTDGDAVLQESTFRSMIYPIPASAIRRLRDSSGQIDTNFQFLTTSTVTIGTNGQFTIITDADEKLPFSAGALNSTQKATNFLVALNSAVDTASLTGTVTTNSSSNVVNGIGTAFTTQLAVGDFIKVGATVRRVSTITNANTLQTANTFGATNISQAFKKTYLAGHLIDYTVNGTAGTARSITVVDENTVTFDMKETLGTTVSAKVVYNLKKTTAREKRKVLRSNRYVKLRMSTHSANTVGPWSLGIADVFRVTEIRKKGSAFSSVTDGTDVTSLFTVDTGQRDSHYELASISKNGVSLASGDYLLVKLDHFEHDTSQGDGYLSVDSYPIDDVFAANTSAISTAEIPIYTSPLSGGRYDLRNCIDTRPIKAATATSATVLGSATENPSATADFALGLAGLYTPVPNEDFTFDMSYYLGRKDIVVLDTAGSMRVIEGVPSKFPITPQSPSDAMILGTVDVSPYPSLAPAVANANVRGDLAVRVKQKNNRRYTMRDIGVLDQRLTNVEYYNSLSLLERETATMKILDDNGLDRFKNGFLVDPFTGSAVADVFNVDYAAAIDPKAREVRPTFDLNNVDLVYSSNSVNIYRNAKDATLTLASSATGFANGETVYQGTNLGSASATGVLTYAVGSRAYVEQTTGTFAAGVALKGQTSSQSVTVSTVKTPSPGPLAVLPYTHQLYAENPYATTTRNAAGLMWNWVGHVTLTPDGDFWTDTTTRPETRINFDGNLDAWQYMLDNAPWATEWNDWQTYWTGQETLSQSTVVEGTRSTSITLANGNTQTTTFEDSRVERTVRTTSEQVRNGLKTVAVPETIEQRIGPRVVNVTLQPRMRSRIVKVMVEGLKPRTRVYAFFDGEGVSEYCRPIDTAAWDTLLDWSPSENLNAGSGSLSIAGLPITADGFDVAWLGDEGDDLVVDASGRLLLLFRIPNETALHFPVGTKTFRLSDSSTNSVVVGQTTTSAEASYTAAGIQQETQDTVVSTRNVNFVQQTISESRTVTGINNLVERSTRVVGVTETTPMAWASIPDEPNMYDPLAQSILMRIDSSIVTGAFVTKFDLFFATKHESLPVIIQLREMDAQTSGVAPKVLPLAEVVLPAADVNVSDDGSVPTPAVFPAPIYLQRGYQYALVIMPAASNPEYRVWMSELGQTDVRTGERVTVQPYVGVAFASANDKTYSALQNEDVKFRMYIANFDTSATGTLYIDNARKEFLSLANTSGGFTTVGEQVRGQPQIVLTTLTGTANVGDYLWGLTSNAYGQITSANNSSKTYTLTSVPAGRTFTDGEHVRFKFSNTINTGATGNTITVNQPFGFVEYYNDGSSNTALHLSHVGEESFTVGMQLRGQSSNVVAYVGGDTSLRMNVLQPMVRQLKFTGTSIDWAARTTEQGNTLRTSFESVTINENNEFDTERRVLSATDEDADLGGASSLQIKGTMRTFTPYLSPVVDLAYLGAIVVGNNINNDSTGETAASGGNALARYISRVVVLNEDQDAEDMKVFLTLYQPITTTVKVYAKYLHAEDSDLFKDRPWVELDRTATASYSDRENKQDFREAEYRLPASVLTGAGGEVQYENSQGVTFTGYKYFAIKIVMLSPSTSLIPRGKDLRGIALQI